MSTFRKLKAVRDLLNRLPGIKTYKDFDLTIEIGYFQEKGTPLSLKQLLLLEVASKATVRRHLDRLISDGMVVKHTSPDDHRSVHFTLSAATIKSLHNYLKQIGKSLE
jgi:DNA-binding MarR family transcriptional regulator